MLQLRRLASTVLLCFLVLALGACDSNGAADDDDPQTGSFTLNVSGDTEATVEGFAFFGEAEHPETGEEVFVLFFSQNEDLSNESGTYFFVGRNSNQPGEGAYSFADTEQEGEIPDTEFVLVGQIGSASNAATYVSDGGSLTIDDSGGNRVEGSVAVDATGFRFTGTEAQELEVTIEGSFNAVQNDDVFVPFTQ